MLHLTFDYNLSGQQRESITNQINQREVKKDRLLVNADEVRSLAPVNGIVTIIDPKKQELGTPHRFEGDDNDNKETSLPENVGKEAGTGV